MQCFVIEDSACNRLLTKSPCKWLQEPVTARTETRILHIQPYILFSGDITFHIPKPQIRKTKQQHHVPQHVRNLVPHFLSCANISIFKLLLMLAEFKIHRILTKCIKSTEEYESLFPSQYELFTLFSRGE